MEAFYENNKQQEEKNDEDATERSLWEKIDAAGRKSWRISSAWRLGI